MKTTEQYLELFEGVIEKQAELVGRETAVAKAKLAGLTVTAEGRIARCVGNPAVVLLRLIKYFAEDGNLEVLSHCTPLISEIENIQSLFAESDLPR